MRTAWASPGLSSLFPGAISAPAWQRAPALVLLRHDALVLELALRLDDADVQQQHDDRARSLRHDGPDQVPSHLAGQSDRQGVRQRRRDEAQGQSKAGWMKIMMVLVVVVVVVEGIWGFENIGWGVFRALKKD